MKRIVLGLCFLLAATLSASTNDKIVVTTLLKTTATAAGQSIVFPASYAEVTAMIVDLPAAADTGWHVHPFPRYAYVMDGSITVESDRGARQTYRAGDFVVEQTGIFHHGTTTVPTRLLVIGQAEAGKGNQINR